MVDFLIFGLSGNMWQDALKTANVNINVIATGAGANLQGELWAPPGSSAYLSGASFPYSPEEQEELLGFMPEHFCSQEAVIDLASAAYMKAYQFGGKKPVGVGITASVASEKVHRGEHQVFVCVMSDDKVWLYHQVFEKGIGKNIRSDNGSFCDTIGLWMIQDAVGISSYPNKATAREYQDATQLATERFFARPFFTANGKRLAACETDQEYSMDHTALMPGAFNPPHDGHFGTADTMWRDYATKVVFEITAQPPHKEVLTVQQCLQRAKLLQGYDRLFTVSNPYYLDKARAFPGVPLVLGADAMVRMLDPKWGLESKATLQELYDLETDLYIVGRNVNGKWTTMGSIADSMISKDEREIFLDIAKPVRGEWDISSTEIRNKLL